MKACQDQIGRVFVIRLENGDTVPACIENFASEQGISVGQVVLIGGISSGDLLLP